MSWVVYNVDTCHIYDRSPTKGGATRKANALRSKKPNTNIATAESNYFNTEIDHEVEVKNLMSGALVKIRASERGSCCDPSTETYWSM